MALFSVYFDEKDEKIRELIESNYKDHMFIHDGYCLVKANVTSGSITEKLGIWNADTKESSWGVVLKLNGSYSGYADGEIWNWLDKNIDN